MLSFRLLSLLVILLSSLGQSSCQGQSSSGSSTSQTPSATSPQRTATPRLEAQQKVPTVPAQGTLPDLEKQMVQQGLVNIQDVDSTILVELKYSTTDNFVGKDVYGDLTRAYLQPDMARKLSRASQYLRQSHPGYRLLVYDAARPNSVQYILWDALDALKIPTRSKPQYVADPKVGSIHNFGCAIDLTVADERGQPLDMGTQYDYFGPLAYPRSEQEMLRQGKLTAQQIANRQVLRQAMTRAGFSVNPTEWWHFDGLSRQQAKARYGMIK